MRWRSKSGLKRIVAFFGALFVVTFSVPIGAFAEDDVVSLESLDVTYYDAEQYALSKTYLYAIKDCYTNDDGTDAILEGFETNKTEIWDSHPETEIQATGFLPRAIGYSTNGSNSAWLMDVFDITGSNKIGCAELGGRRNKEMSDIPGKQLGITMDEMICGLNGGEGDGGLYKGTNEETCKDSQDVAIRSLDERDQFLEQLFNEKINAEHFGGGEFAELNSAELFYAYKNSFVNDKNNCGLYYKISSSKPSGVLNEDYFEIVVGFDESTGEAKISYVTATDNDWNSGIFYGEDEPTYIYAKAADGQSEITCGELIRNISSSQLTAKDEDNPVRSAQNLYLARAVENCNSKYSSQLSVLRTKRDEAREKYEAASGDESGIYDEEEIDELKTHYDELEEKYQEATENTMPWQISDANGVTRSVQCAVDLSVATSVKDEDEANVADSCYENAGPLGWVVCPIIHTLLDVLNKAYSWVEDNYLRINVGAIFGKDSEDRQSSVYTAWSSIRNIANLIFIGLLLVVIYSQITGFGIDNYGIKKILPKLVVMAILINLSYIICQLSVELSNIIGVGIRNIFNSSMMGGEEMKEISGSGLFIVANTGAGLMSASAVIASFMISPGLVVVAFFALLSAVVSIITLLLILIAREVGIVLLTVISPVMFAFAMLPNTEKIFNKYVSIAKSLLFLYPLCSLVIGAGRFAGVALSNMGEQADMWRMSMAALLVEVIPYLFIPTLLKNSLNTVNGLGDKIRNVGQRFNRGTVGRMSESSTARSLKARMNAGINREGNPTKLGQLRAASIGRTKAGRRSMARSITMAKQAQEDNLKNLTKLDDAMSPNSRLGKYSRADDIENTWHNKDTLMGQLSAAMESGDTDMVESLTNRAISRYGSGAVSAIGDMIAAKSEMPRNMDEKSGFNKSIRKYGEMMKDNRDFSASMTKKAGDVAEYLSNGGYAEIDGREQRVGVSYYTANSNVVSSAADYATQSTATLRRFAALSGGGQGLTQEMAQTIRDSNDDSIKSGLMSESSKKDIIDYVAGTGNSVDASWSSGDLRNKVRVINGQNESASEDASHQSVRVGDSNNGASTETFADGSVSSIGANYSQDGQGFLAIQENPISGGAQISEANLSDTQSNSSVPNHSDVRNANSGPVNEHHFNDLGSDGSLNESSSNTASPSVRPVGTGVDLSNIENSNNSEGTTHAGHESSEQTQSGNQTYRPAVNYKPFSLNGGGEHQSTHDNGDKKWNSATHSFGNGGSSSRRPLNAREAARKENEHESKSDLDPMDTYGVLDGR